MSDAPTHQPDADALERFSVEFRTELNAFSGPLIYKLLQVGRLDVAVVVDMIRDAIKEADDVFEERGALGFKAWWAEEGQTANRVERTVVNGDRVEVRLPSVETDRGTALRLDGAVVHRIPEAEPIEPADLEPEPDRWRHRLREMAAEYFGAHYIKPKSPLGRDFRVGPDLVLDSGVPARLPADEEAVRIARRLTALDNPDRLNYRMKLLRGDGPYISSALLEDVAAEMNTTTSSARRNLLKGGFELPEDLTYVRASPRQAT